MDLTAATLHNTRDDGNQADFVASIRGRATYRSIAAKLGETRTGVNERQRRRARASTRLWPRRLPHTGRWSPEVSGQQAIESCHHGIGHKRCPCT